MSKLKIIGIARTKKEQEKGLMFHDPLKENQAMLFIFDKEERASFWNKNVSFPIDVAFFDKKGNLMDVRGLKENQTSSTGSVQNTKFVLETRKDWFKDNKIKNGESIWELLNIKEILNERS
jgi:uncharacterized membrane protein (UPF0127 family)